MIELAFCDKDCLSFTGNCEPLEIKSFICLGERQMSCYRNISCVQKWFSAGYHQKHTCEYCSTGVKILPSF